MLSTVRTIGRTTGRVGRMRVGRAIRDMRSSTVRNGDGPAAWDHRARARSPAKLRITRGFGRAGVVGPQGRAGRVGSDPAPLAGEEPGEHLGSGAHRVVVDVEVG